MTSENWRTVIRDIGLTDSAIARAVECDRTTIGYLRSGRTSVPRWDIGQALLALRDEVRDLRAADIAVRR